MTKITMHGKNDIKFKNEMGTLGFNIPQTVLKINKYFSMNSENQITERFS
jgi:hypothetical protein